jgi:hypothetical protein
LNSQQDSFSRLPMPLYGAGLRSPTQSGRTGTALSTDDVAGSVFANLFSPKNGRSHLMPASATPVIADYILK